jgi:hypothetical protein
MFVWSETSSEVHREVNMQVRELGRWLAEPRSRTAVGVVFAFALSWHFLFGGSHIESVATIYGSWAAAVLCLFVMSRAESRASLLGEGAGKEVGEVVSEGGSQASRDGHRAPEGSDV